MKMWMRFSLIIISLLFIAGGAFNDGDTGYFFALPFVMFLCMLVPGKWTTKAIITIIAFLSMAGIHRYLDMSTSSFFYPMIGQEVTFEEDILTYGNHYLPIAGDIFTRLEKEGKTVNRQYIYKGSTFVVTKLLFKCGEIGGNYCIYMSDGDRTIEVDDRYIRYGKYRTDEENFCTKVTWEYCNDFRPIMRNPFRYLSNLMYYPVLPLGALFHTTQFIDELSEKF